jgi:hypothetical protein
MLLEQQDADRVVPHTPHPILPPLVFLVVHVVLEPCRE